MDQVSERITIRVEDGVADVRLAREDKMNALDDAMFSRLISAAEEINADKAIRCIVLSGQGRAFCAGLDMGNFAQMAEGKRSKNSVAGGGLAERTYGIANRAQQAVWGWRTLRVPVIAAVHGVALGGGFQVMLGADIRIVHPDTKLSILEVKWGLVPDMSSTAIMRRFVRDDIIRELTYTGRIFSGAQGKEYGFVTHLSENPFEHAMTLAREIASKSPGAVQTAKNLYNHIADQSDAEALLTESVLQDELMGSKNQVEAVMAGLQKRTGNFVD